jgi:hypothetical protein
LRRNCDQRNRIARNYGNYGDTLHITRPLLTLVHSRKEVAGIRWRLGFSPRFFVKKIDGELRIGRGDKNQGARFTVLSPDDPQSGGYTTSERGLPCFQSTDAIYGRRISNEVACNPTLSLAARLLPSSSSFGFKELLIASAQGNAAKIQLGRQPRCYDRGPSTTTFAPIGVRW